MSAARFLDTNVLLYAYDLDAPVKRAVALRLVEQGWSVPGQTAISVQVLQEMHVNLVRQGISPAKATQIVRDFAAWPVVDNTLDLFQAGLDAQARWKISLWTPSSSLPRQHV
jgi:predicted nucleic acid-binding protein